MRFRVWGLLLALSFVMVQRPVYAVLCDPVTPMQQVRRADVVLVGKVEAIAERIKLDEPMPVIPTTVTVERIYKGQVDPTSTVYVVPIADAPKVKAGERWLLFLSRSPAGDLKAGPCTPSTLLRSGLGVPPHLWVTLNPIPSMALLALVAAAGFAYRRSRGSR